jgi:hypothetical protein
MGFPARANTRNERCSQGRLQLRGGVVVVRKAQVGGDGRAAVVSAVPARDLSNGAARWSPCRYHLSTPGIILGKLI